MIKQITKIDQEVYLKKVNSEKDIKQAESGLNEELKILTQKIMNVAQKDANQKYQKEIEKQIESIETKKIQTNKIIQEIKVKYKQIEEKTCEELFGCIFSMEE